jgi:DNA primase
VFRPYRRALPLDPDVAFLRRKGIQPATARRFEAGAYYGRGFCRGAVAVRLHDRTGNPLGYAVRRLDPEEARREGKWKLPPLLPKRELLYGYHLAFDLGFPRRGLVLVECPWSVMRLAQLGFPAMAMLGTSLSEGQCEMLLPAPTVLLMLDGDSAGRLASARLQHQLWSFVQPRVVLVPDAHDPDDLPDKQLAALASVLEW